MFVIITKIELETVDTLKHIEFGYTTDSNIVEQVKNVKDDTNVCLKGYLQSHLYFDNYYNDISIFQQFNTLW